MGFDPQALTSLTDDVEKWNDINELFRSTGSYEPDLSSFLGRGPSRMGFDPQALTSLTDLQKEFARLGVFRSTGSYEPDLSCVCNTYIYQQVSIHRLLRA